MSTTAYATTDMNPVVMTLIPVDTFIEAQRKTSGEKEYHIPKYPLIEKFDVVLQKTSDEVTEAYKQKAHSETGLQYMLRHAENIINKFQRYFNQVCDLHRIIEYVKMKSQKFGKQRIEYAKSHRLPEYDESLIEVCLRFLRNYYGEIECMKLLLTV